jgi:hypothetical protein
MSDITYDPSDTFDAEQDRIPASKLRIGDRIFIRGSLVTSPIHFIHHKDAAVLVEFKTGEVVVYDADQTVRVPR